VRKRSTSYRKLSALPAFGLYSGERLVATIRAPDALDAREIFRRHGFAGTRVRRIGKKKGHSKSSPDSD
jgi:hypothetical protein